jgi:hypothetical protein
MPFLILVNLQRNEEVGGRLPDEWREILDGFDRTIARHALCGNPISARDTNSFNKPSTREM